MKKKIGLLLLFFIFQPVTRALECPPIKTAPLCPESGSTLLDETYPTQAFVMSNGEGFKQAPPPSKEQQAVTHKYINTVIKSYDYENVPQIILALSSESEFDGFKKLIEKDLEQKKIKPEKIKKILGQLTHLQAPNYTWQQDYFESFINPQTGMAQVRRINSYSEMRQPPYVKTTTDMAATGQKCGITEGRPIMNDPQSFNSGEMGGNIEGAPGGFCLAGNNQGREFTKSFCGSEENIINLNVSWLSVGHVDEIFKIVPNFSADGRPRECQFSLMAASPDKALEVLQDPKYRNRPYFDFGPNVSEDDLEDLRDSRSNVYNNTNIKLCKYIIDASASKIKPNEGASGSSETKSVFIDWLLDEAQAGASRIGSTGAAPTKELCKKNVTVATNTDMHAQFLKDTQNYELNKVIQKSIDKDKELIKSKILSRLPQCAKYFDVIDVPNYFEGGPLVKDQATGEMKLPLDGNINAFLPNPTNSVLMNNTLLFPDAGNSAYSDYLTEEMAKRKIKSEYIPTWDYAHLGMGNIHCSSHSLPYCQPRSKK